MDGSQDCRDTSQDRENGDYYVTFFCVIKSSITAVL